MKLFKNIDKKKPVFIDIESHGFYCEICLVQVVQDGWKKAKVVEYPDPEKLRKFVKKHHTVWHNASYDLGTIGFQSGKSLGLDFKVDDTFYAGRSAYPEYPQYTLDYFHDRRRMGYYDPLIDKKKMQKSFATVASKKARKATEDQIRYAKADVYTLRDLWKDKEIRKVMKKNKAYALDIQSLKYSLIYQRNGIPVNREALKKERAALVDDIAANTAFLGDLNPRSPKQVPLALGTKNSSKETLIKVMMEGTKKQKKLAKVVYEQRRLLKADKMLETWDYDRVHTFFNPAGTITGRFNASGGDVKQGWVNTQQITRKYQYLFHNTDPKMTTFEIDYGTAELRAGCSIMKDEKMYQELKAGRDLHIEAAKLTGIKKPTRADRQKGKSVSFGLIFSMSWKSFKEYAFTEYGVAFTDEEAQAIHQRYHNKYQGISAYQSWCWRNYKTMPIESAMGRRNICRLGTDASNFATQSSIAEATKWSVHFLVDEYPEALDLIINVVHDAVYMEVLTKDFKKWSRRLEKAMLLGWKEVCKSDLFTYKDIPMPVEVEIVGEAA